MFIIVKYGNNEELLCNPHSSIINLLTNIKRRTGYGNTNVIIDLSDETGLVKELDLHKYEYATKYLVSHGTYILVEKQALMDDGEQDATLQYQYVPLLDGLNDLFPNYALHVAQVEKKRKSHRTVAKSPSPAGRMGVKPKKPPSRTSSRKK